MRKAGILFILLAFFIPFSSATASDCQSCYDTHRGRCKKLCSNAGFGRSGCESKCRQASCKDSCTKYSSPSVGNLYNPYKNLNTCEACRARARNERCPKECPGLTNMEEKDICFSRCANQVCSKSCNRAETATEKKKYGPKITCFACRKRKITECGQECGDPKEPGFVSCRRACAEKACLEICRPDLF